MYNPNRKSTIGTALRQYWSMLAHYWQPVLAPALAYVWDRIYDEHSNQRISLQDPFRHLIYYKTHNIDWMDIWSLVAHVLRDIMVFFIPSLISSICKYTDQHAYTVHASRSIYYVKDFR